MNAIFAKTIYTGKQILTDSYLLYKGTKIIGTSASEQGKLTGRYDVLTPAFIDAHAHIGMVRSGEPQAEAEANERLESLLAHADALDSIQMDDTSFRDSIESGVLYSCVVPGSGNIIGGKSAVIRNYGRTTSEALITRAGIKAALGFNPMSTTEWKGTRPFTRMGSLALLRQKFHDVRQKIEQFDTANEEKKADITFNAEEEILRRILKRDDFLRVHVHKIDDIASLLRIVDEYKVRITVDHACDVNDKHIFEELKRRKVPVIYGPLDAFAYKVELKHESWRNLKCLLDSGVTYGLMSDHPVVLQKMLHLQLRWFIRHGLDRQEAIEVITRKNASVLGIDDILGTLEEGKWASFACWNGDPFNLASFPVAVFGEGRLLYSE